MQEEYYIKSLYPLQDGILKLLKEIKIPFYLTGGTALSRHYFNHRYSDDLDLFVNDDSHYGEYVNIFNRSLIDLKDEKKILVDTKDIIRTEDYSQFLIKEPVEEINLKIDLINDVAMHYGDFEFSDVLGKVDSWRNILSNKLSALYRNEVKDVADIVEIAAHKEFDWKELIFEAKEKDSSIEPIYISNILNSFPVSLLDKIKWVKKNNPALFMEKLQIITNDITLGKDNSLFNKTL